MTTFPLHSHETAPEASKPILDKVQKGYGFVPNLIRVMAEAPAAAEAYTTLIDIFERTSFSDTEKQIVAISASYVNACSYCVAAHSTIANMKGVDPEVIEALRTGATLSDPKLEALANLTRAIVVTRGWPSDDAKQAFFGAGYTTSQYLEVIVGVTMKTISNYVNHAADTPLDAAFSKAKWAA